MSSVHLHKFCSTCSQFRRLAASSSALSEVGDFRIALKVGDDHSDARVISSSTQFRIIDCQFLPTYRVLQDQSGTNLLRRMTMPLFSIFTMWKTWSLMNCPSGKAVTLHSRSSLILHWISFKDSKYRKWSPVFIVAALSAYLYQEDAWDLIDRAFVQYESNFE